MQLGPDADTDSAASPADLAVGDTVIVLLPGDHPHGPLAEYCTAPVWRFVRYAKNERRSYVYLTSDDLPTATWALTLASFCLCLAFRRSPLFCSCVKLPKETDRTHVAAAAVPAVLAYSALHYGARLAAGESVLICNG